MNPQALLNPLGTPDGLAVYNNPMPTLLLKTVTHVGERLCLWSPTCVKTPPQGIDITHSQELMNKSNGPPTWEKKTGLFQQRG